VFSSLVIIAVFGMEHFFTSDGPLPEIPYLPLKFIVSSLIPFCVLPLDPLRLRSCSQCIIVCRHQSSAALRSPYELLAFREDPTASQTSLGGTNTKSIKKKPPCELAAFACPSSLAGINIDACLECTYMREKSRFDGLGIAEKWLAG
jgi:hypothetical protein